MGALWLSLDNGNCCSCSAKSAVCIDIPWIDGWDFVLVDRSVSNFIFLKFDPFGP